MARTEGRGEDSSSRPVTSTALQKLQTSTPAQRTFGVTLNPKAAQTLAEYLATYPHLTAEDCIAEFAEGDLRQIGAGPSQYFKKEKSEFFHRVTLQDAERRVSLRMKYNERVREESPKWGPELEVVLAALHALEAMINLPAESREKCLELGNSLLGPERGKEFARFGEGRYGLASRAFVCTVLGFAGASDEKRPLRASTAEEELQTTRQILGIPPESPAPRPVLDLLQKFRLRKWSAQPLIFTTLECLLKDCPERAQEAEAIRSALGFVGWPRPACMGGGAHGDYRVPNRGR